MESGPLTASQLRDLTGLSRPSIAGQAAGCLAVPVGGEAGDGDGDPSRVIGSVVAALAAMLRQAGGRSLRRTVMGAPGLAGPATGMLRSTGGLPAWHRALPAALRERCAGPVVVENEVNLAAVAEHRPGSVRDRGTFVLLWPGQGAGAAVVLTGALRHGASGGAGEIGFLPVPGTGDLPSAAGRVGGFHALAGADAVTALAAEHGLHPPAPTAAAPAAAAEALVRQAAQRVAGEGGGPHEAFLTALADRVAVGVAAVAAVLFPGCVVLGGEAGRAGERPWPAGSRGGSAPSHRWPPRCSRPPSRAARCSAAPSSPRSAPPAGISPARAVRCCETSHSACRSPARPPAGHGTLVPVTSDAAHSGVGENPNRR